jgi:hypothetical protein
MHRDWRNEAAALWLAPLVSTIPLIPFLSIPSSPFFLGRLMDDPTHPMNWPHMGPMISALAVVFDAEILGIVIVLFLVAPAYVGLRESGKNTARNILLVCAGAGILASQIARMIAQGFRQADLRAFANSGTSPILGCLCGLAAGGCIVYFANRRLAPMLIWCAPVAALAISALVLTWSSDLWRGH